MAKRRNLKKEKALRNEAYARKFRKRNNRGRFGRRRFFNNNENSTGDKDDAQQQDHEEGATDL